MPRTFYGLHNTARTIPPSSSSAKSVFLLVFGVLLTGVIGMLLTSADSENPNKTGLPSSASTTSDSLALAQQDRQDSINRRANRIIRVAFSHSMADGLFQDSRSYALKAIRACEEHAKYNSGQTYRAYANAVKSFRQESGRLKSNAQIEAANFNRRVQSDYASEDFVEIDYQIYQAYKAIGDYIDAADNALRACQDGYSRQIDNAYRAYAVAEKNAYETIQGIRE